MGDIRCSKCGEPWDADTLHDEIASRLGLALVGLADGLAGDDVDGLVSDLEDAQALGLFS